MICPLCTSNEFQEKKMKSCQVYQCSNCALQYFDDDKCNKDSNYLQNYKESRKDKSVLSKLRQIQYSIDVEHLKKNILKGNVLDVGCSTGEFLNKLHKVSKLNLYGIDTDESAISVAKNKCDSTIDFVNTDLINYQTNLKFDCIIFRGSFQFLGHDLKKTLEKISKISSNNCKIIIYSLPNSNSILYYLLKDEWNLFDMFSKTLIFNKTSIMKLCEIYNYKISECTYPYLETPYANPVENYKNLIELIEGKKKNSFPFWGNIMQIVLEK
tara:strand:- start:1638 stop:2444 length:807 start_codon:yes stop_codon:yes gene_type:complete